MAADAPGAAHRCAGLQARAVDDLSVFTSWTRQHGVLGVVGEVGWPSTDDSVWAPVASRWTAAAVDQGLGVYVWGAAEQWDAAYPLAVYRDGDDGAFVAGPQARLVESLLAPAGDGGTTSLRGVALSGPSFGASWDAAAAYSSTDRGVHGADYRYPSWRFLVRLAERGVGSVRLAVLWERLQPRLNGPLDTAELAELRRVLDSAHRLGMSVVIDLHNYGRYADGSRPGGRAVLLVGSPGLPASTLGDLWQRLAVAVGDAPALAAYGLMNEPYALPGGAPRWEATTRAVVAAVRAVDTRTLILVPGYGWSAAATWRDNHPAPWVDDAAVAYEAHQYFDTDRTGRYEGAVEEELAAADARACAAGGPELRGP